MNGLARIAGCDRPHQPRDWGNGTEQSVQPEPPFTVFEMDTGFAAAPVNAVVRRDWRHYVARPLGRNPTSETSSLTTRLILARIWPECGTKSYWLPKPSRICNASRQVLALRSGTLSSGICDTSQQRPARFASSGSAAYSRPQYRLRVGDDVRVFYDVTEDTVEVLAIVPKSQTNDWLERYGDSDEEGASDATEG